MASHSSGGIAVAPNGARAACATARLLAVREAIAAMAAAPDRPLELDEMGRNAHLSPWYFNRIFRETTGVPPRRFQTALRMAAAKRLLLTTEISVSDICLEVGYSSLGTFVTHFRELVGVSPGALRQLAEQPAWSPEAVRALRAREAAVNSGAGGEVIGTLSAPDDEPRVIFIGLFEHPSPQGTPRACAMLTTPGTYRLGGVRPGRHHVAAAALPPSSDILTYLLPDEQTALVAAGDSEITATTTETFVRHLRLRNKRVTDPPILLVPHALMARAA